MLAIEPVGVSSASASALANSPTITSPAMIGGRAFAGDDVSVTLAHVLTKEPDWSALPVATPGSIRRLLARCLTKDPKQRLRDIGDVRDYLDTTEPAAAVVVPRSSRLPWIAAAVATAALLALAAWTFSLRSGATEPRAVVTTLLPPAGGAFDFNQPYAMPAISPDGTRIVYGAKGQDGKPLLWLG